MSLNPINYLITLILTTACIKTRHSNWCSNWCLSRSTNSFFCYVKINRWKQLCLLNSKRNKFSYVYFPENLFSNKFLKNHIHKIRAHVWCSCVSFRYTYQKYCNRHSNNDSYLAILRKSFLLFSYAYTWLLRYASQFYTHDFNIKFHALIHKKLAQSVYLSNAPRKIAKRLNNDYDDDKKLSFVRMWTKNKMTIEIK